MFIQWEWESLSFPPVFVYNIPAQAEVEQRFLCYQKLLTSSCLHLPTGTNTPYAHKCNTTREMHFQRKSWTWSVLLFTLAACMVSLWFSRCNFSEWQNHLITKYVKLFYMLKLQREGFWLWLSYTLCFICGIWINNLSQSDTCFFFTNRKWIHK